MIKKLLLAISLLFFLPCTASEKKVDTLSEVQMELTKQRQLFKESNLSTYTFKFTEVCYCPNNLKPKIIEVKNYTVSSAYDLKTKEAIKDIKSLKTIEQLFDLMQIHIQYGSTMVVVYDKKAHYPLSVKIDVERAAVDGHYFFFIALNPRM